MGKKLNGNNEIETEYVRLLAKISENVRRVRLKKGLTQEDMLSMGFERRWFQRIESGTYSISLPTLFRLSQVFNVKIEEFFQ
jgi:transcriptional regulator with XRE-family HTH domain